jgi:hypothetical protein
MLVKNTMDTKTAGGPTVLVAQNQSLTRPSYTSEELRTPDAARSSQSHRRNLNRSSGTV